MNFLGRFKVGTKIIAGYVIALLLMVGVGSLAVVRLAQLDASLA